MRLARTMAGVAGLALAAAPAALAETGPPLHTVSVSGAGEAPIVAGASKEAANAAYRAAMASASADGLSKAQFLAGQVGTSLAAGVSPGIAEQSGYVFCTSGEYTGVQPDFGNGAAVYPMAASTVSSGKSSAPTPPKPATKTSHRRHKHKLVKHSTAKRSSAASCEVSATVTLTYVLSG